MGDRGIVSGGRLLCKKCHNGGHFTKKNPVCNVTVVVISLHIKFWHKKPRRDTFSRGSTLLFKILLYARYILRAFFLQYFL